VGTRRKCDHAAVARVFDIGCREKYGEMYFATIVGSWFSFVLCKEGDAWFRYHLELVCLIGILDSDISSRHLFG